MPTPKSPRQELLSRVTDRMITDNIEAGVARALAQEAVDAFYGGNAGHADIDVVMQESRILLMESVGPVSRLMAEAFQRIGSSVDSIIRSMEIIADQFELYASMIDSPDSENKAGPVYDASGLPVDSNPEREYLPSVDPNRGIPCVEEGCLNEVPLGAAYCDECLGVNRAVAAMAPATAPRIEVSTDGGRSWSDFGGVLSVEVTAIDSVAAERLMFDPTEREWHLSAARSLRKLGCTYGELKAMAERDEFPSGRHRSLWFNVGNLINLEQLDRANFVLDNLDRGDAFDIEMDDAAIERAEERYPTDRITGAPHHYIVNGDHDACGCGGHLVECEIHAIPRWRHSPSICGVPRTLCNHSPRHFYREPCEDYAASLPAVNEVRELHRSLRVYDAEDMS